MGMLPEKPTSEEKVAYLKEALRLAELPIEYEHKALDSIERKCTLLITLYVSAIVYILSWKNNYTIEVSLPYLRDVLLSVPIVIILTLGIAALLGVGSLLFRPFAIPGAQVDRLMHKDLKGNLNNTVENLLAVYKRASAYNRKVIAHKTKWFRISFCLGVPTICLTPLLKIIVGT